MQPILMERLGDMPSRATATGEPLSAVAEWRTAVQRSRGRPSQTVVAVARVHPSAPARSPQDILWRFH